MFQVRQPHTQPDTQSHTQSHTQAHTVSSSDDDGETTIDTNPASPRQRHDSGSCYSLPTINVPKKKKSKELKQSKQDISHVLVDLLKDSRKELIQSQQSVIEVCYSKYDHWAAFL